MSTSIHDKSQIKKKKKISKTLSYILRHGALKYRLEVNEYGYIKITDILKLPQFLGVSLDNIFEIVYDDSKGRYTIKQSQDEFYIKANQGHTINIPNLELTQITDATKYPTVIHGTSYRNWLLIKNSFGIHRMKRNHIHLAIGEPGEARSGIRHDSSIIIYIDIKKAIESGISFFISPNNVILTKGLNGFLPKSTFVKVYDRKKKELIL
jgi:2'-phosphotransferase